MFLRNVCQNYLQNTREEDLVYPASPLKKPLTQYLPATFMESLYEKHFFRKTILCHRVEYIIINTESPRFQEQMAEKAYPFIEKVELLN